MLDGKGQRVSVSFDTMEAALRARPALAADPADICATRAALLADRQDRMALAVEYPEPLSESKIDHMMRDAKHAGLLTVPPACSRCGKSAKRTVGHHSDYRRPLDVRWLCDSCHRRLHNWLNGITEHP